MNIQTKLHFSYLLLIFSKFLPDGTGRYRNRSRRSNQQNRPSVDGSEFRSDEEAYGDLYQWGRAADGHQKRNSGATSIPTSLGMEILSFHRVLTNMIGLDQKMIIFGRSERNNTRPEGIDYQQMQSGRPNVRAGILMIAMEPITLH